MTELPRYILGVDPGKKSGIALYDLMFEVCEGWELQDPAYGDMIESLIERYRPAVVVEQFIINAATVKNTQAPWSLENVGVARHLAQKYGVPFERQPQSSAKRFATNERLQALGWYVPGRGHMADAQRQVLLYIAKNGWWAPALDET